MSLESWLSIVSFSIAISGFIALLIDENRAGPSKPPKPRRKIALISSAIVALILLTGIEVFNAVRYQNELDRIEEQIVEKLGIDRLTLYGIFERLAAEDFDSYSEALHRAVRNGVIGHTRDQIVGEGGKSITVRFYYNS